jgi:hypothetical protein
MGSPIDRIRAECGVKEVMPVFFLIRRLIRILKARRRRR